MVIFLGESNVFMSNVDRDWIPLVMSNIAIEATAIEIVGLPVKNGDFP